MKRILLSFFVFCLVCAQMLAQSAGKNYEFRNAQWYDGTAFVAGTWYSSNGQFTKKAPSRIDSVISLDNRWVIPPLADAFCSSFSENPSASNTLNQYMGEGVFYLQIFGNTQEGRTTTSALVNKPGTPEAVYSNGGITCTLGYPFLEFEGPANKIRNPAQWSQHYGDLKTSRKMLGNGYWFIDNKDALSANWDKIKAQKPGVISIYLLDEKNNGGKEGKGLTADVAKLIIKKAHKANLRVVAHVETAEDVRLCLTLGVDGIANLPGNNWDGNGDTKKFDLSDADLKLLAKKKTPISLLLSHAQAASVIPAVKEFHKKALKSMMDAGVNVVIGSDDTQRTLRTELNYWFALGGLDNASTLKVLCENTPRAIFPGRKIGKIADGYEASFIALSDDPLTNVLKTRLGAVKVKNGVLVK